MLTTNSGSIFVSVTTPPHPLRDRQSRPWKPVFNVIATTDDLGAAGGVGLLKDRRQLRRRVFALTHNYTGIPMIAKAVRMILAGEAGRSTAIGAIHPRLLAEKIGRKPTNKQAFWRTDPAKSGALGRSVIIATHAYNLFSGSVRHRRVARIDQLQT